MRAVRLREMRVLIQWDQAKPRAGCFWEEEEEKEEDE